MQQAKQLRTKSQKDRAEMLARDLNNAPGTMEGDWKPEKYQGQWVAMFRNSKGEPVTYLAS